MKWVLIIMIFGYGDAITPALLERQFDDRELCVRAKEYYESKSFKQRITSDFNRDTLRMDVQCHQLNYPQQDHKK